MQFAVQVSSPEIMLLTQLVTPLQTVLLLSIVSSCLCNYGSISGSSDYGSSGSGSYGPSYEGTIPTTPIKPRPEPGQPGRVVQAALQTKHTIRYVNVDLPSEDREPQIIEVGASPLPIVMHFKSASSRIRVQQSHSGAGSGQIQETKSEDQPQHLRHEVVKPIIQEVREIVMPYRRVVQEIRPVVEEIQTVVAKKSDAGYEDSKESSGGITGSASFGGVKGTGASGNVKRSTRYSGNYGRY